MTAMQNITAIFLLRPLRGQKFSHLLDHGFSHLLLHQAMTEIEGNPLHGLRRLIDLRLTLMGMVNFLDSLYCAQATRKTNNLGVHTRLV
jgi:hypothetical protein